MKRALVVLFSVVVVVSFAVSASAVSPAVKVDCNKGGSIGTTLAHLAQIGSTRGITIVVNGTCKENITISGFDHLVLKSIAQGTTLQDASNGSNTVVAVWSSNDVTLQGFTINGGATGIWCGGGSVCKLYSNTIQQSAGAGASVAASNLYLTGNNVLNNAGFGVTRSLAVTWSRRRIPLAATLEVLRFLLAVTSRLRAMSFSRITKRVS